MISVMLGSDISDHKRMMERLNIISESHGLHVNSNETKFMIVSRNKNINDTANLTTNNIRIERVRKYRYLVTIVIVDNDHTTENKRTDRNCEDCLY